MSFMRFLNCKAFSLYVQFSPLSGTFFFMELCNKTFIHRNFFGVVLLKSYLVVCYWVCSSLRIILSNLLKPACGHS